MHALSRTADASILRHASLNAKVLAQKTAPSSAFTRSIDMVVLADIALPIPKPLTARLVAVGVDERPATLISSALTRVITSYKNLCEADYRRRRASLEGKLGAASTLPALYVALFSKAVKDWTTFLLEDITPRVVQIQRRQGLLRVTSSEQQRRRFNQNAVPLLERFFERNAFPSRLEKFELAATCDMDYRQIHVWFQNRRSRWRKEGRTLTRIETSDEPREVLENTVVNALLPGEPDEDSDQASCDEAMKNTNQLPRPH
ncbi:hypothetical protein GY45DRAFT_1375525 [Cubamyces sp. BRFM 1775]|nr:hypothetical protein GY45DRAFT_1375525 [Cubamyces sp. BRFM 1775]